jgi:hypothetical protein
MSICEFKYDLGNAGEFDFIIEYAYFPASAGRFPGEKDEPEHVIIDQITFGGIDWTNQLAPIIRKDEKFLKACRDEWLDEVAEHQLKLAGM